MKAALSGYFVERQELNDALRNVTRTEGGADRPMLWCPFVRTAAVPSSYARARLV